MVAEAAKRNNISVSVCGQMSSDPMFIPLLIGLGLRQISVTPHAIPELKEVIRNLTIERAVAIAERASSLEVARDVENYLWGELKKLCPEFMQLD